MSSTDSSDKLFDVVCGDILCGCSRNYQIERFIGQGSFGLVARCRVLNTDEQVAVKVIRKDRFNEGVEEVKIMEKIKMLDPDKNNLQNVVECFLHKGHLCLIYELLDVNLFDYMNSEGHERLPLSEIRVIAHQLLVALKALKSANLVHCDIKPDNIMLVNRKSEPFKIKVIDFGLTTEASKIRRKGIRQNIAFRSPEAFLHLPNLDEGVDMWSLGCLLATLYLGYELFPWKCEYEAMRMIAQLIGMPSNDILDAGLDSDCFFDLIQESPRRIWRLKSPEMYTQETGKKIVEHCGYSSNFYSLNYLMMEQREKKVTEVREDTLAFISLLKQMLEMDPRKRITPSEALRHDFLTMNHFPVASGDSYVVKAKEMMSKFHVEEDNSVSAQHEQENSRISEGHGSKVHKSVNAADLNGQTSSDMSDNVAAQKKEENIKASGSSEKLPVSNKACKASANKEEMTSGTKEQKDISKNLEEVISCVEDVNVTSAPGIRTKDQEDTPKSLVVTNKTSQDGSSKAEVTSVPVTGTKATDVTSEKLVVRNTTSDATFSRDKITSVPRAASKDPKESSRPVTVKNGPLEASSNKEEVTSAPRTGTNEKNPSKSVVVENRTSKVSSKNEETSVPRTGTKDLQESSQILAVKSRTNEGSSSEEKRTSVLKPMKKAKQNICENVLIFDVIACVEEETSAITVVQDQQEEPAVEVTGKDSVPEVKPRKKWFRGIRKFFARLFCIPPKKTRDE